jgi:hypothetical protein
MPERATVSKRSEKSAEAVLCAEQRIVQEGGSPSGAQMRGAISKGGRNDSLAAARDWHCGGQGVHREVEWEGHEEKYRAVIDGGCPADEPVGQRWDKVEPALWRRRRSHSPTAPRCLRTARYGRTVRDLSRIGSVSGRHRSKRTYKGE